MSDYSYIGTELHLFAKAVRWKAYWRSQLLPYVRGAVLEVGAGIGNNAHLLAECCYRRWVCLEPDPLLCTQLRERIQALKDIEVVVGTLDNVPKEERFDAILYLDVLEHIMDDFSELQRATTHLRHDGNLIVLSPAHQWLLSPFDQAVGHFRRYSRSSLRAAAPPELSLVLTRYLDAAGLIASFGNRLLLRRTMPTEKQITFWDRYFVPVSRYVDPVLGYCVGKSVLNVWRRKGP